MILTSETRKLYVGTCDHEHMGARHTNVTAVLRDYSRERHRKGELPANRTEDRRLLIRCILDSMAVLERARFIDAQVGVELSAGDTTFESFDRLKDIVSTVKRRLS